MPAFYIVTKEGFLKKYYSEPESFSNGESEQPVFSDFLRKAFIFKSFSEANETIINKKLINCFVINQYGELQTQ
jgi:hypothetical protein